MQNALKGKDSDFIGVSLDMKSAYSLTRKGDKINYSEIFKNPPNDLSGAITRTIPKIKMFEIKELIEATPEMSDIRKQYLIKSIEARYNDIIFPAYNRQEVQKLTMKELVSKQKSKQVNTFKQDKTVESQKARKREQCL